MANGNVGTWRVGAGSRFQVDGTVLYVVEGSVAVTIDDFDTTHYESTGIEGEMGPYPEGTFTIRGNWDASRNPLDSPPNLKPGQKVANVRLYVNKTDNTFWACSYARVISFNSSKPTRGLITVEIQLKSNGGLTFPTGSV